MKAPRVALLAFAGMLLSSVSVYSFTPPGGMKSSEKVTIGAESNDETDRVQDDKTQDSTGQTELAHFTAGSTVMIDGRMGHPRMLKNERGETFLMLEARATSADKPKAQGQVNLSIVIDRSGSMKGTRLRNAINAAIGAVERLHDGDMVSVVTFDTRTEVVVPASVIGPASRSSVVSAISGITLGGDTCISCGIETGMAEMGTNASGRISRMIVLSDGDANHGLKDIPGFRSLAQRARDRGIGISTVGVDVDYNEKILSAIAVESNGRHYFVENDAALARVFEGEAEALTQAVASGAEIDVDLAPGVELDRVFDRTFRRSGNRITVPLGTFAAGDVKTVLIKVRVPSASTSELAVASVEMHYRDLVKDEDGRCAGKLGVEIVDTNASALDGVVAGRVNRSETAAALKEANALFAVGKSDEARRRISEREQSLRADAEKAKTAAPAARAADVADDFDKQLAAVSEAQTGFATPPPAAAAPVGGSIFAAPPANAAPIEQRQGKKAVRRNEENATNLGF